MPFPEYPLPNSPEDPMVLRLRYKDMGADGQYQVFKQILQFIPGTSDPKPPSENDFKVVHLPDVVSRHRKELAPIISNRFNILHEFVKGTEPFKQAVKRFFFVNYEFLFNLDEREDYELLLGGNIFLHDGARKVERKWYQKTSESVEAIVQVVKRIGLSTSETEEDEKKRRSSMEDWARLYYEYYEEQV